MAKEDNLTSWKKGQSGNINGRPKGSLNRSTIAKKWLTTDQEYKNPLTQDLENLSQEDIMTLALINKARKGDVSAYKALMDSGYGNPKDSLDINTAETINIDFKEIIETLKNKS
jgi:hypothetical protein|tara:strand:+ start:513 stop:854 length:342 start_codon:yes stop_codon:yes gene_type:complete